MTKGVSDLVVAIGFAVVLLSVSVLVFMSGFGKGTPTTKTSDISTTCNTNDDCDGKVNGIKCVTISEDQFNRFCGCLTSLDCIGGRSCGENNKCE